MKLPDGQHSESLVAKAIEADTDRTTTRTIGACATVIILGLFSCLYSCSQPKNDPIEQTRIQADNQTRIACIQRGGNWIPVVTTRYDSGKAASSEMSCVRPEAVAEVSKLNLTPVK